jgi:outer membrane protein OmpA-like peptidoglycan-associated protein
MTKRASLFLIPVLLLSLTFSGCQKWKNSSRTAKGGVIGAGTGGAIGGAIGSRSGNTAAGAVIGAAVGGAAGAVIGRYMDKQKRELEEQIERENQSLPPGEAVVVERVGEGLNIRMGSGILFDVNRHDLRPASRQSLQRIAEVLQKYQDTDLLVTGHTDSDGTEEHNQALSERRASSVANHLVSLGVLRQRIKTQGFGELQPIASNSTREGKQKNRRVEIIVTANEKLKKDAAEGKVKLD